MKELKFTESYINGDIDLREKKLSCVLSDNKVILCIDNIQIGLIDEKSLSVEDKISIGKEIVVRWNGYGKWDEQ